MSLRRLMSVQFLSEDTDNEISVMAFRLLVQDLRPLFTVMNEGTMNVLGTPGGQTSERGMPG